MKRLAALIVAVVAGVSVPSAAAAYNAEISLSIGEGVYFVKGDALRGPISLELVPSFGWKWFKFDLGLYATLEELRSADRDFIFRPGARLTPPVIPLYLRAAFPLTVTHGFDWGFMAGLGVDFFILRPLGIFLEADTFITRDGNWGDVVPLEFRLGAKLAF